jgi:quinoprotein dehydrogenase-associated probable ABC transporter substrate-binding protein
MRRRLIASLFLIALSTGAVGAPGRASAQEPPDLVSRDVLRVCGDPANMPFSNERGEGFENRIAAIVADELKLPLRFYWLPQGPGFVRNTLGLGLCDLIVGYASGADPVQNTNPYYRSAFVLVVKRGGELDGAERLDDPRLKGRRLGVVAGTPPADHLLQHGLLPGAKSFSLLVDRRYDSPAEAMIADLAKGEIDGALLWGPIGGFFARNAPTPLSVTPLLKERERPALTYRITMGVRHNEPDWKRRLNQVLRRRQDDINRVLLDYGVPLLDEDDRRITADAGEAAATTGATPATVDATPSTTR